MLQYNNWTIEQSEWLPAEEVNLEQQLSFSNGYLCQTAHFEEYYSHNQQLRTYIKGIETFKRDMRIHKRIEGLTQLFQKLLRQAKSIRIYD